MGTVNIFSMDDFSKPVKTVMNLTTSITDLKFSPTSQALTYCSKWKKNAIRMVHIPSYTAFQNFPGAAVGILKFPMCIDYNKNGDFLAMGSDEGKAHLWQIKN